MPGEVNRAGEAVLPGEVNGTGEGALPGEVNRAGEDEASGSGMKPEGPLPRLAMEAADRLEQAGFPDQVMRFRRIAASFNTPSLQALVLGRFSVGKTTLINAFLGYPVLPGGLAPTTGVICRLRAGDPGAVVRFYDGRSENFTGPESLRPYLSLDAASPDKSALLESIIRVEISLPLPLLRDGLEIVDSPGLDEHAARTSVSADRLDEADIVLFVLAADQLMGEVERRFLSREVLSRAPAAMAFVVNFWDRVPADKQEAVRERLAGILDELGPADESTGPCQFPVFYVSSLQTVRLRWKGQAPPEGIIALESWLQSQTSRASQVRARSCSGRIIHAADLVLAALRQELPGIRFLQTNARESITAFEEAVRSARERRTKALAVAAAAPAAVTEALSIQAASSQGMLSAAIRSRIQENPYDSLENFKIEMRVWWEKLLATLKLEARVPLDQLSGLFPETSNDGAEEPFPTFTVSRPAPELDFAARPDTSASVKDAISAIVGNVSQDAGDSVTSWMKRATRAASRINPGTRHAAEDAVDAVERTISLAAYQLREEIQRWGERLVTAVEAAIRRREDQLQLEITTRRRQLSLCDNKLQQTNDVEAYLTTLIDTARREVGR